jgi:carbonic anhydrase
MPVKSRSLWKPIAFVALAAFAIPSSAGTRHVTRAESVSESTQLKAIVANLLQDNGAFVKSHEEAFFRPLIAGQAPRATVVTCSDSRVQTDAFDETPEGDLFMVRNIGNQLATEQGSVEYGVHHLHTPLLIFIGHSSCGAIKAATGNYRKESIAIRRELSTIRIPKGASGMNGVRINVRVTRGVRHGYPHGVRGRFLQSNLSHRPVTQ